MTESLFPTDLPSIHARLNGIEPGRYASTRNFLDGAVTRLSPYLTHGTLSLPQVRDVAYALAGKRAAYKLVFELAWREFYQRTWDERGDAIFSDLRRPQEGVHVRGEVPVALLEGRTGIDTIDASVRELIDTGYVHNHVRMWTAMLATNVAGVHWEAPARWYHYHLLDGDPASNALSWQWVAGSFSAKKYVANQENLNRYAPESFQRGTFLDREYDALLFAPCPEILRETAAPDLPVTLPTGDEICLEPGAKVLLYHPFCLDPTWRAQESDWERILVLEPSHLQKFPRSPKRIAFLLDLAKNIPGLKVWAHEAARLPGLDRTAEVRTISHPAFRHLPGVHEPPAWLFAEGLARPVPSGFMAWWKRVEKFL